MEFVNKAEMRRMSNMMLGKWIEMNDGRKMLHLESDLPVLRVFDPKNKQVICVTMKDVKRIVGDLMMPM